ncbi:50S ribosomal protein L11 methyltransferase [Rhizobium sp. L1K21]|uniref:50S ribosomal protein L11 methyltransferase n=1 Tax=Rhizobium sp. L1K21 TaxID=2954933 RepID=UPI002092B16E|nr:50S ribosomal protein L11 methyltransferase [Rhizobium sp. L1K21]MCO6185662.1 50S ribosomal protein L11 methyltransferase [Rhizobium sp. L1K21]
MSEIRLYVQAGERLCETILDHLTIAFEDSEYAIATQEIDEDRDIWEASVYTTRADEEAARATFQAIVDADFPDLKIEREELPDIDWVAKSLEGLKPVRAGRFLVHGSHDRDERKTGDIAIEIDAGQAFGTGHHGTTAGCLEMIDLTLRKRTVRNALDLGTGSGVLAIAAHKVARIPVLATDIDPVAVRVARENARKNHVVSGITFAAAPGFHHRSFAQHGPFDLIIANILAKPLMKLAPALVQNLAPGGTVILSGILASQRWKVLSAYNGQKLAHVKTIWRNGWVTIVLQG